MTAALELAPIAAIPEHGFDAAPPLTLLAQTR
jgi:hypothetical protein